MGATDTAREGTRNILGWALVILLIVPWLVIQFVAALTRWLALRRGGIE